MKTLSAVLLLVGIVSSSFLATGCSSAPAKEETKESPVVTQAISSPVNLGASSSGRAL